MSNEVFRKGLKIDYNSANPFLDVMYKTVVGRLLIKPVTWPPLSKMVRAFLTSPLSKPMIKSYITKHDIDMTHCVKQNFRSFNDFFTRKLDNTARQFCNDRSKLCAPCDGKLSVYKIDEESVFEIKGTPYTLKDILHSSMLANKLKNGWCFIYRLEPSDYHRYSYIDNGVKTDNFYIRGVLHTVQPIAINRCKVFKHNCREFTLLRTANFGDVVQVEIGALCVGRITNHHGKCRYKRGDEKGMFEFGGSTIIQLFESGSISPDYDIIMNTAGNMETSVKMGESVGYKL